MRDRLKALGYVEEAEEGSRESGVTTHDPTRSQPGINLYCSPWEREVRFVTSDGEVLRRVKLEHQGIGGSCHVELRGQDELVAVSHPVVSVFDAAGAVSWVADARHHHDVAQRDDGSLYTLTIKPGVLKRKGKEWPISDHAISVLDSRGNATEVLRFSELFGDRVRAARVHRMEFAKEQTGSVKSEKYIRASDVFHPNSIEILQRPVAGGQPGDVLICIRELDLVAIVNLDRKEVVWEWGPGELDAPHHPSILKNGNILVFDNGRARKWSRVVEVDPETNEIVWQYRAEGFFSKLRGAAQRLANGNTLITESAKGRVFEVTPDGEVVWDFWNPEITEAGKRRQIYRMFRLDPGTATSDRLRKLLGPAPSPAAPSS